MLRLSQRPLTPRHRGEKAAALVGAAVSVVLAGCSGGPWFSPARSASEAVPSQITGFEVQKAPKNSNSSVPEIAGRAAKAGALAVVIQGKEDVARIIAFQPQQDPSSLTEGQLLALVSQVDAKKATDLNIAGTRIRCYPSSGFGLKKPDGVCLYVDGVAVVYVVANDQGEKGAEDLTKRALTARAG